MPQKEADVLAEGKFRYVPSGIRSIVVCENGHERGALVDCTLAPQPCGCRIVGNGTLPHPLDIKRCPKHST